MLEGGPAIPLGSKKGVGQQPQGVGLDAQSPPQLGVVCGGHGDGVPPRHDHDGDHDGRHDGGDRHDDGGRRHALSLPCVQHVQLGDACPGL